MVDTKDKDNIVQESFNEVHVSSQNDQTYNPNSFKKLVKTNKKMIRDMKPLIKETGEQIDSYQIEIEQENAFKRHRKKQDIEQPNKGLMSYQLREITEFYEKLAKKDYKFNQEEFDPVDDLIKNLPFFIKFSKYTRQLIAQNSRIIQRPKGDFVIRQGDIGEHIYIILYGSCNVLIKRKHPTKNIMIDYVRKF